jgi:hypothetical protein
LATSVQNPFSFLTVTEVVLAASFVTIAGFSWNEAFTALINTALPEEVFIHPPTPEVTASSSSSSPPLSSCVTICPPAPIDKTRQWIRVGIKFVYAILITTFAIVILYVILLAFGYRSGKT